MPVRDTNSKLAAHIARYHTFTQQRRSTILAPPAGLGSGWGFARPRRPGSWA